MESGLVWFEAPALSWPTKEARETTSLIVYAAISAFKRVVKFWRKWTESGLIWFEFPAVNKRGEIQPFFSPVMYHTANVCVLMSFKIRNQMNGVWFGLILKH